MTGRDAALPTTTLPWEVGKTPDKPGRTVSGWPDKSTPRISESCTEVAIGAHLVCQTEMSPEMWLGSVGLQKVVNSRCLRGC